MLLSRFKAPVNLALKQLILCLVLNIRAGFFFLCPEKEGLWWPVKNLPVFASFCLPGSVLSWPKRRSRAATSAPLWCLGSHRWSWARTRPSPMTTSSTWTPSRKQYTTTAPRGLSKAALRATMPLSLHTDRLVSSLSSHLLLDQHLGMAHTHTHTHSPNVSLKGMKSNESIRRVIWEWTGLAAAALALSADMFQPALTSTTSYWLR